MMQQQSNIVAQYLAAAARTHVLKIRHGMSVHSISHKLIYHAKNNINQELQSSQHSVAKH
eukprot:3438-Heterococcus_DN1.PRE.3